MTADLTILRPQVGQMWKFPNGWVWEIVTVGSNRIEWKTSGYVRGLVPAELWTDVVEKLGGAVVEGYQR